MAGGVAIHCPCWSDSVRKYNVHAGDRAGGFKTRVTHSHARSRSHFSQSAPRGWPARHLAAARARSDRRTPPVRCASHLAARSYAGEQVSALMFIAAFTQIHAVLLRLFFYAPVPRSDARTRSPSYSSPFYSRSRLRSRSRSLLPYSACCLLYADAHNATHTITTYLLCSELGVALAFRSVSAALRAHVARIFENGAATSYTIFSHAHVSVHTWSRPLRTIVVA